MFCRWAIALVDVGPNPFCKLRSNKALTLYCPRRLILISFGGVKFPGAIDKPDREIVLIEAFSV